MDVRDAYSKAAWEDKLIAQLDRGFPMVLSHQGGKDEEKRIPSLQEGLNTHIFSYSNTLPLPISTLSPLYTLFCLQSQKEVEFSAPLLSLIVARIRALNQQHNKTPKIQRIKVESQRPLW